MTKTISVAVAEDFGVQHFSLAGSASVSQDELLADVSKPHETSEFELSELRNLKANQYEIAQALEKALSKALPGGRFNIELEFHRGSIEWSGLVTAVADGKSWVAAANLGGTLGLALLIKNAADSVIGKYLSPRYGRPTTKCSHLVQKTKLGTTLVNVKTAINDLCNSLIEFFIALTKHSLRKGSQLPYMITGANPYVFSSNGNIPTSIYSKVSTRLFGWASLFVVGYVTIASQKIATEFGIVGQSTFAIYLFSAIAGIIVFTCDRFILSYPKVRYRLSDIIEKHEISSLVGRQRWTRLIGYWLRRFVSLRWAAGLILTIFRMFLAIVVSGLLVSTFVIGINKELVENELSRVEKKRAGESVSDLPSFPEYQKIVNQSRRAYFNSKANQQCRQVAARGVTRSEDNIIIADESNMIGAPLAIFGFENYVAPPNFDCGVKDNRPCLVAGDKCPEFGRIERDQGAFDRTLANLEVTRSNLERELTTKYGVELQKRIGKNDFSMKRSGPANSDSS